MVKTFYQVHSLAYFYIPHFSFAAHFIFYTPQQGEELTGSCLLNNYFAESDSANGVFVSILDIFLSLLLLFFVSLFLSFFLLLYIIGKYE